MLCCVACTSMLSSTLMKVASGSCALGWAACCCCCCCCCGGCCGCLGCACALAGLLLLGELAAADGADVAGPGCRLGAACVAGCLAPAGGWGAACA